MELVDTIDTITPVKPNTIVIEFVDTYKHGTYWHDIQATSNLGYTYST